MTAKREIAGTRHDLMKRIGFIAVACGGFTLYVSTLAPTVLWGDDARFQRWAHFLTLDGGRGGHPVWVTIAHLFTRLPVGDIAFRGNLVSAVFGALTLACVFGIVLSLTKSVLAGLLGSAALAISHTFWLHSVRAEVYTLNSFFLALLIYVLLRWKGEQGILCLLSLVYAVSLSNHLLMAAVLPGLAFLFAFKAWRLRISLRSLLLAGLVFLISLLPYLYLVKQTGAQGGLATGIMVTVRRMLMPTSVQRDIVLSAGYLGYQFPTVTLLAGCVGLVLMLKKGDRAVAIALLLIWLGDFAFAFDIQGPHQYSFFIPAYLVFAIWSGVGFSHLDEWLKRRSSHPVATRACLAVVVMLPPVLVYRLAPTMLKQRDMQFLAVRELPGRDFLEFHLWPPKRGYYGAREFVHDTFQVLPPNAVIIADYTMAMPLIYGQMVEGYRPDVEIVEVYGSEQLPFVQSNYQPGHLFLAHVDRYYDMQRIGAHFEAVEVGPVYQLVRRSQS